MAWRLCPGFRTTARSLALKMVGVGEGAGEGEAMHAYQIEQPRSPQTDVSAPVAAGAGKLILLEQRRPGVRVLVPAPRPRLGQDRLMPWCSGKVVPTDGY